MSDKCVLVESSVDGYRSFSLTVCITGLINMFMFGQGPPGWVKDANQTGPDWNKPVNERDSCSLDQWYPAQVRIDRKNPKTRAQIHTNQLVFRRHMYICAQCALFHTVGKERVITPQAGASMSSVPPNTLVNCA